MLRTPEQYVKSLNDGRVLYLNGERIADITKSPYYKTPIDSRANGFSLCSSPKFRDLFTIEESGDRYCFLWKQPRTREDLIRRRNVILDSIRWGGGIGGMGPDALAAAGFVATRMDKKLGTHYMDAVEDYRQHLKDTDPAITGAITDVKGDRSLHPMQQKQHQDFFVRVVDRQKKGIVVRGAKNLISATPTANELIVTPSRAHSEENKDCALAFATPANAKGVKLLASPRYYPETGEEAEWNWPSHGGGGGTGGECLIVFDDVFIPWNRVFMCGEWQFSRDLAWTFGVFHRLFGTVTKQVETENLVGAAALMAEYNGLEGATHIREKLSWLAMHTTMIRIISESSCENPDIYPEFDLATPNVLYTNISKYIFANEVHQAFKLVSDIAGGISTCVHSYKDWMNPEERPYLEKYFAGKAGIPTEHRLKAARLAHDLTGHGRDGAVIHVEGSLAAQMMAIYASADWKKYKAIAKRVASIPGWREHPDLKDLPEHSELFFQKVA